MLRLLSGLWLVVVAGLALLAEALATGLEVDSIHCIIKGDEICPTGDMMDSYPPATLGVVLPQLDPLGLAVMGLCLMPLAVLAVLRPLRERPVLIAGTLVLAALIPWHMIRENGGACDIPVEVNRLQYLAPAIIGALLSLRFARRHAGRGR
ncbi:hypothetical protein PE067_00645 [Paracoccus sp. DMF-8]|uniref:hypothetical protein n=1 Tax=Paracoccus sp. DMF-8 TaxID=3019445 RepID=UPI0023E89B97|nr:hypothetical protein [Paracoccus sp. DMF-8]MDF3604796.1 hypothetical protein [Paracoccus sp. DMF-8]